MRSRIWRVSQVRHDAKHPLDQHQLAAVMHLVFLGGPAKYGTKPDRRLVAQHERLFGTLLARAASPARKTENVDAHRYLQRT
jgi:hypothetical protein